MLILDLWGGISFHPLVVVGLGNDLLFNFIVGHCVRKTLYAVYSLGSTYYIGQENRKQSHNGHGQTLIAENLPLRFPIL